MFRNLSPLVTSVPHPRERNRHLRFTTSLWLSLILLFLSSVASRHFRSQKMSALCAKVLRCLWRWRITLPSIQATTISHLREDSTPTEGISNQQSVSIWQRKHLLSNRCHALQPRAWTLPRWAWHRIKNDLGLISLMMNMNFLSSKWNHRNDALITFTCVK